MYIIIYALNLFDLFMTKRLVNLYGMAIEWNVFGQWIMGDNVRILIFKILLPALGLFVLWKTQDRTLSKVFRWVLLAVFIVLAIYHIVLYFITK